MPEESPTTSAEWTDHLDSRFPREPLATLPTPLDYLPNLTQHLGGPRIYIKRDDLTGLALGGDKPRKLEYLLADAKRLGADIVITGGSSQSNHVRLTGVACRKLGLRTIALCTADEHAANTGNLLLSRILGIEIQFHEVAGGDHWLLVPLMEAECDRLRSEGSRPYLIPISGTTTLSCLGYVRCAWELSDQFDRSDITPTALYITSGTGGNLGALAVGFSVVGRRMRMVGVNVNRAGAEAMDLAEKWRDETATLIGVPCDTRVELEGGFVGSGYGEMTAECAEAIRIFAETEGIFLDPVYTGKAGAGLIAHIREGRLTVDDTVVFVHTGGIPALFAYSEELGVG